MTPPPFFRPSLVQRVMAGVLERRAVMRRLRALDLLVDGLVCSTRLRESWPSLYTAVLVRWYREQGEAE